MCINENWIPDTDILMINLTACAFFVAKFIYSNAAFSNDKKIPLGVQYLQFRVITSNTP